MGNWGVPFSLHGEDSSPGGIPFSGRQGESLHKASSTEFDVAWIPQRGPATAIYVAGADYWETPDHASLDLVADIEIIVHAAADDWTPAASMVLVSKRDAPALATGGGYELRVDPTTLTFAISDGVSSLNMSVTPSPGLTNGQGYWIKASYSNADKKTTFYVSDQALTTPLSSLRFKEVGVSTAHGGGSPTANAVVLRIAQRPPGGISPFTGKIGRAVVRSGIGGSRLIYEDIDKRVWFDDANPEAPYRFEWLKANDQRLDSAIATLRLWADQAETTVVTTANIVAVTQTVVTRLGVFFDRFADLLEKQYERVR